MPEFDGFAGLALKIVAAVGAKIRLGREIAIVGGEGAGLRFPDSDRAILILFRW